MNRSGSRLRGVAHVGVLRQLIHHDIPIDMIVGVSAGAVVAAYYAAVGLDLDELIDGFNVRLDYRFDHRLKRWCGVTPRRIRELETARFDRLHHGAAPRHRLARCV